MSSSGPARLTLAIYEYPHMRVIDYTDMHHITGSSWHGRDVVVFTCAWRYGWVFAFLYLAWKFKGYRGTQRSAHNTTAIQPRPPASRQKARCLSLSNSRLGPHMCDGQRAETTRSVNPPTYGAGQSRPQWPLSTCTPRSAIFPPSADAPHSTAGNHALLCGAPRGAPQHARGARLMWVLGRWPSQRVYGAYGATSTRQLGPAHLNTQSEGYAQ